jgi:hypothetical protein
VAHGLGKGSDGGTSRTDALNALTQAEASSCTGTKRKSLRRILRGIIKEISNPIFAADLARRRAFCGKSHFSSAQTGAAASVAGLAQLPVAGPGAFPATGENR